MKLRPELREAVEDLVEEFAECYPGITGDEGQRLLAAALASSVIRSDVLDEVDWLRAQDGKETA